MITPTQKARLDSLNQRNADDASLPKVLDRKPKLVTLQYSFAAQGGGTGDYNLTDVDGNTYSTEEAVIVTRIIADEATAFTSGGAATVVLKAGATSLTDALAFDTGFTGQNTLALASSATAIAVAASSTFKITVGTAALTAGLVRFTVEMIPRRTN